MILIYHGEVVCLVFFCSGTVIFQLSKTSNDPCRVDTWPVHEIKQGRSRSVCFLGESTIAVGYDDGRVRVWSTKVTCRGPRSPPLCTHFV
jgi:hypothetical protein